MELRLLRYFVAVAEELNFTRAAARLRIAQPSLSVQIRNLEQEVGCPLLARDGRAMRLTAAGKVFLVEARALLDDAELSLVRARRAAEGEIGQLSIGYNTPAEFRVFPKVIPTFRTAFPEVSLEFHALKVAQQLGALDRQEIDIGFVWLPMAAAAAYRVTELGRESLIAALPEGHRLAGRELLSVRDFADEPMILFARRLAPASFHQIEHLFEVAGARLNPAYELENLLSMINFVAMGSGCALLPDHAHVVRRDGVVYRPLAPPNLERTLAMVSRHDGNELVDRFISFAVEQLT